MFRFLLYLTNNLERSMHEDVWGDKLWNPEKMQNIFVGYVDKHGKKLFMEEKA